MRNDGFLFDSNVLLDIIVLDPVWQAWSEAQVVTAIARGLAFIDPIIYAEVAPEFGSCLELDRWLNSAGFQRLELPYEAGWRTSEAFLQYRRAGGSRTTPLPDFYIGARRNRRTHPGDSRCRALPHVFSGRQAGRTVTASLTSRATAAPRSR